MAHAAVQVLGARVLGGLVVSPNAAKIEPLESIVGQHPQPGPGSEAAGRRALAIAASVARDEDLIVLISGGASSLLAVPADGLTLEDKRTTTGVLLKAGADIYALNTVRKHLSAIKGGRLAAACRASSSTYVLSDVVGDDLSFIASGPTVADPSTYADALNVIDRFGGRSAFPKAIVAHLEAGLSGDIPESPKAGDPRLAQADTGLVGGRHDAMRGAADEAHRLGYEVRTLEDAIVGEARDAGPAFVRRALEPGTNRRARACVVASGETTVKVRGTGSGGRNQEFALAAAEVMASAASAMVLASIGTDGIDGPTDAAGAIVDTTTISRMAAAGLNAPAILDDNNAYACFNALGDLVRTGPTGTNVGDLQIILIA
jgi:hydroxypyruvate reductase